MGSVVFEPFPENLVVMRRTLRELEAADCVLSLQGAVWSELGSVLQFDDNTVDYGNSKVQINGQVYAGGKVDGSELKGAHRVISFTLDSVFPKETLRAMPPIHLLKIDSEGSEWHVLQGAKNLLGGDGVVGPTFVMFEFSPWNINRITKRPTAAVEVLQTFHDKGYYVILESCMHMGSNDMFQCPNDDTFVSLKAMISSMDRADAERRRIMPDRFEAFIQRVLSLNGIADMMAIRASAF